MLAERVDEGADAPGLKIFASLALNGKPLTAVQVQPTDTVANLRSAIAKEAGETCSFWLLLSGRILHDHETLEEASLLDGCRIEVIRCQPLPSVPPPTAPSNFKVSLRCALTGELLSILHLWPIETLASMRDTVSQQLGKGGPVQLLINGQLLVGPMTLVEAGLFDGTIIDVVQCAPRFLATASADNTARLWCAECGGHLMKFEHTDWVNSAAVSSDGQLVVTTTFQSIAQIWSLESKTCIRTLTGHEGPVLSGAFSSDNHIVATGSYDRTAKLWNVESGECTLTFEGHHDGVMCVTFSPDGQSIATASADRTSKVWNLESGTCILTFEGHGDEVRTATFSPDSRLVATASADHSVKLWDMQTGECVRTLVGHSSAVGSAAFSPHGRLIVTAAAERTAMLWNVESGECILVFSGHDDVVTSASFSLDGQLVATSSADHTTKIWNTEIGQCRGTLIGHGDAVTSTSFFGGSCCHMCAVK